MDIYLGKPDIPDIFFGKQEMPGQSKKEGKDQESIQSSTTPEPGYQWKSGNITITNESQEVIC